MALASIADYQIITGTTVAAGDETTRITALLSLAGSAVLAGAYGQAIASADYTDVVLRPWEGIGYFPQRPVTAVASVTLDGVTLVAGTDYRWTPGGNGRPAQLIRRVSDRDSYWAAGDEPQATFTAGWATGPAQVTAIVVAMVKSTVNNAGGPAPSQQSIGGFAEGWDSPQQAGLALTPEATETLHALCAVRSPTSVPTVAG